MKLKEDRRFKMLLDESQKLHDAMPVAITLESHMDIKPIDESIYNNALEKFCIFLKEDIGFSNFHISEAKKLYSPENISSYCLNVIYRDGNTKFN